MGNCGCHPYFIGSPYRDNGPTLYELIVFLEPLRLHLAAQFQCNGALQLLIDAKAALKKRDVNGCNALHRAGLGDNAEGVQ